MNPLANEVDQILRSVDKATATRLERLVRDALDPVNPILPGKARKSRSPGVAATPRCTPWLRGHRQTGCQHRGNHGRPPLRPPLMSYWVAIGFRLLILHFSFSTANPASPSPPSSPPPVPAATPSRPPSSVSSAKACSSATVPGDFWTTRTADFAPEFRPQNATFVIPTRQK